MKIRPRGITRYTVSAVYVCFLAIMASYVFLVACNSITTPMGKFSPDSLVYIDIAQCISHGEGISRSAFSVEEAVRENKRPLGPIADLAPLYPIMIAGLVKAGLSASSAALLVPALFLGPFLLLSFLTARELFGLPAAPLSVASMTQFVPLRTAAGYAWSEIPGITFMMLVLYVLAVRKARAPARQSNYFILFAGVATGLAYATRYALLPLTILGIAILIEESRKRTLKNWAVFSAGFFCVALPIMARNIFYSGTIRGGNGPATYQTWGEAGKRIAHIVFNVFITTNSPYGEIVLAAVVALLVIFRCVDLYLKRPAEPERSQDMFVWGYVVTIFWSVGYLAFLAWSTTKTTINAPDLRLTLPATVVTGVLAGGVLTRMFAPAARLAFVLAILVSLVSLRDEAAIAMVSWRSDATHDAYKGPKRPDDLAFLASKISAGKKNLIIAREGLYIPLYFDSVETIFYSGDAPETSPVELSAYVSGQRSRYDKIFVVHRQRVADEEPVSSSRQPMKNYFQSVPNFRFEVCYEDNDSVILCETTAQPVR